MSTSTLTVATATVSVYRAIFTLSGDNVQYQPLLSTFNEKNDIKNMTIILKTNHFGKCSETERHAKIPTSPKHAVTEAFRGRKILGLNSLRTKSHRTDMS